eukprot:2880582-Amphidinium_carterae.1
MKKLTTLTRADISESDWDKKRSIEISYRGWKVPMVVKNVDDELDVRVKAELRGWACACEQLTALPAETDLCDSVDCQVKTWSLAFLKSAQRTRDFVKRLHEGESKKDGETLVVHLSASLQANKLKISGADKLWWIDYEFLKHVSGEGGRKRLEQKFVDECLPGVGEVMSLATASERCTAICKSDLFSFCGSAAQGSVKAASKLIADLNLGLSPVRSDKSSEFLEKVWQLLPRFVVDPVPGSDGAESAKPVFGKQALDRMWATVSKKKDATLGDFRFLGSFSHLLEEETRAAVKKRTLELRRTAPVVILDW